MAEPDRCPLARDDAQPHRRLAEGAAPPQRLERAGYPSISIGTRNRKMITSGVVGVPALSAAPSARSASSSAPTWTARSMARATNRVGMPADVRSRTTASGVTRSGAATSAGYRRGLVDLDRFLAANEASWRRLAALTAKAGRSPRRLSEAELDQLLSLYERTATLLSVARGRYADAGLNARLSRLVAAAGAVIYGTRPRTWRRLRRFFTHSFPAALWRIRVFLAVAALLTFGPALVVAAYFAANPAALDALTSQAERAALVRAGTDYYSAQPSAQFASKVFTNNVQVALLAFGLRDRGLRVHRPDPRDERPPARRVRRRLREGGQGRRALRSPRAARLHRARPSSSPAAPGCGSGGRSSTRATVARRGPRSGGSPLGGSRVRRRGDAGRRRPHRRLRHGQPPADARAHRPRCGRGRGLLVLRLVFGRRAGALGLTGAIGEGDTGWTGRGTRRLAGRRR